MGFWRSGWRIGVSWMLAVVVVTAIATATATSSKEKESPRNRHAYAAMMYMGTPRDYDFYVATRVMMRSPKNLAVDADRVVIASITHPPCARPAINQALPREQVNLAEWALQWHRKGLLEKIVDPHIVGTIKLALLEKFVEAAKKCLADYGVDRPTMGDVLWKLECALQLQEAEKEESKCDPSSEENNRDGISLRSIEIAGFAAVGDDSGTVVLPPLMHGR